MIKTTLKKILDFINRTDPRKNDEIEVKRFDRIEDLLETGEEILWQDSPSEKHAWSDHDQLRSPGAYGDRPGTIRGRVTETILAFVFLLFMAAMGLGSILAGLDEINRHQGAEAFFSAMLLILFGLTLVSGLFFLLRPLTNRLRAGQLTYILTKKRAIILQRGHGWPEMCVRSPVILSVSLLLLYGVLLFSGIFFVSSYQDLLAGAGFGTWAARLAIVIFLTPLAVVFSIIGWTGLRFQTEIIRDAIVDRQAFFARSFSRKEIAREDFPVISRLRQDGVGDVILGGDLHWEYDIDFPSPWFKVNAVGFLSVPDAEQVADLIRGAEPSEPDAQTL